MSITDFAVARYRLCGEERTLAEQDFGESLFDSSGFKSLAVRIKEQQMSGVMADLQRRMFDYDDYNDMYFDDDDGFDPNDPFSALEYVQKVQASYFAALQERQKTLQEDFAEYLKARKISINAVEGKSESSVKATQAPPVPQVGSGETSPASAEIVPGDVE